MMNKLVIIVFMILAYSNLTHGEQFTCSVSSHTTTNDNGIHEASNAAHMLNWTFTLNVQTGEIQGGLASNVRVPNRKVEIVEAGGVGKSITIVTTRGGSFNYLADLLVINTYVDSMNKPFDLFVSGFGLFSGLCKRL